MTPLDVTIVRAKQPPAFTWMYLFVTAVLMFPVAWALMVLIGAAGIAWSPGYWQTFFLLAAARLIWPPNHSWLMNTKAPR